MMKLWVIQKELKNSLSFVCLKLSLLVKVKKRKKWKNFITTYEMFGLCISNR